MLNEFKPTVFFLVKFFALFGMLSALYGWFIQSYDTLSPPQTDPLTRTVAGNCVKTAGVFGYSAYLLENDHLKHGSKKEQTYDSIRLNDVYALSVEEGCNGVNIMILFVSFVFAFGGKSWNMILFIPSGLLFIHMANIGRLFLLSFLNVEWGGRAFHFFHKYGFTAFIYLAVLFLWLLWVTRFSGKNRKEKEHVS